MKILALALVVLLTACAEESDEHKAYRAAGYADVCVKESVLLMMTPIMSGSILIMAPNLLPYCEERRWICQRQDGVCTDQLPGLGVSRKR